MIAIMAHGPTNAKPIPIDLARVLAPRILARVNKLSTGCWVRYVNVHPNTGYTWIPKTDGGKKSYFLAHRVMYVWAKGPIPGGLTIDHLCEVRACCNPDHLRAVTHRENVLKSKTNPFAVNAARVACKRGHALTGDRRCRECQAVTSAARRQRVATS